ncbi:MAG: hypothetical protein RIG77_26335 [Cyclobacteriaceae bacterium]
MSWNVLRFIGVGFVDEDKKTGLKLVHFSGYWTGFDAKGKSRVSIGFINVQPVVG